MKDDEAERSAYEQGREDGYSLGWAAVQEQINGLHNSLDAHDEMIKQLKAERDAAYVRGLERAREACIPWLPCKCDPAYRDRGRHESNAWHELAEEIDAAIQAEIDRAKLD